MDFPTRIEKHLEQLLPELNLPEHLLYTAARYSVLGGGKRIRPLLTLLTTEALGGSIEAALTPACALELLHTYSLIHDDLPCMDDDDFRRGKPSLHKRYNEGHAVLTGDYLLTYTFELLAKAPHLSAQQKLDLITSLAQNAGANGMIGGQVLDIQNLGQKLSLENLITMHHKKTGALISSAVEFGAICGNAQPPLKDSLHRFSKQIGLAFQIVDDILDVMHVQEKRGSQASSDIKNKKTTFVTLLGYKAAQNQATECINSAIAELAPLGSSARSLISLAQYLTSRTK